MTQKNYLTVKELAERFNVSVSTIYAWSKQKLIPYLAATDFKNQQIIIAADNDKNKAGEIAAKKVIEAGYADGYRMPPIEGYDWNDYINYMKGQNE